MTKPKPFNDKHRRRSFEAVALGIVALEPRVLLDAAGFVTGLEGVADAGQSLQAETALRAVDASSLDASSLDAARFDTSGSGLSESKTRIGENVGNDIAAHVGTAMLGSDSDGIAVGAASIQKTVTGAIAKEAPVFINDSDDSSGAGAGNYQTVFIENDNGVSIVDADGSVNDADDDIVEIVVTLTNGQTGDVFNLPADLPGNIVASSFPTTTLSEAGTITLTLTGDGSTTAADWNTVLKSVVFLPSTNDLNNPSVVDRVITFQASDLDGALSNTTTTTVFVRAGNDGPSLDLDDDNSSGANAGNANGLFVENSRGTDIHSNIVVADPDNVNLASANVVLLNAQTGDEFIINGIAVQIGDVGSVGDVDYTVLSDTNGEISVQFSGEASLAAYDAALESVQFNNITENPNETVREITVSINDGAGDSPPRTSFIRVQALNDAPTNIVPLTDRAGLDGESVDVSVSEYFTDIDGDTLEYTATGLPQGFVLDAQSGLISGQFSSDASVEGPYTIVITATDPDGAFVTNSFVWAVGNPAPTLAAFAEYTTELGASFTFDAGALAHDVDGDVLKFSASGLPQGLVLDAQTGVISGAPTEVSTLPYQIELTVSDGQGGVATQILTLTVFEQVHVDVVEPHFVAPIEHDEVEDQTHIDTQEYLTLRKVFAPYDVEQTLEDILDMYRSRTSGNFAEASDISGLADGAHIWVEGVSGRHAVLVHFSETISDITQHEVTGWSLGISESNWGGPDWPEWAEYVQGNDYIILNRTGIVDMLSISVQAILDNGQRVIGTFEVDMHTGMVSLSGDVQLVTPTFSQSLNQISQREYVRDTALLRALGK